MNLISKCIVAVGLKKTCQPFEKGTAEQCIQYIETIIKSENIDKPSGVFHVAAMSLIKSIMPALVELRNKEGLEINLDTIRHYLEYQNANALHSHPDLSKKTKETLLSFVQSRAGYDANKAFIDQPSEVYRQYGFAQAYLVRTLFK